MARTDVCACSRCLVERIDFPSPNPTDMNSISNLPSQLDVKIARKSVEATNICSFELLHADGLALPPFTPGAHIVVHMSDGLSRAYSLCNDAAESHRYLIAVLRDPATRGGSAAMHDQLQLGSVVRVSPPRNQFELAAGASYSLLLAGGIGITPIISMAEHLSKEKAPFELHYCARSPERTAFRERIAAAAYQGDVHFHFDTEPLEQRLDIDATLAQCPAGTHLYICGPRGFIDAVTAKASAHGWPQETIHFESFVGVAASSDTGDAFEVQLASSGRVIAVPSGKTVVEALCEAGVQVDTSCQQGVCGICVTRVLEGTPDHRDMFLTDDERARNDQFTPCCSRAKSPRLVLDI
jgi:vanillate O-demethylase ferredoxin subunit